MRELLIPILALALNTSALAESTPYRLPGGAAEYSDPYIAAGFRALFTCSAHFLMHRSATDIEAIELADTHELGLPPVEIDEARGLVSAGDGSGQRAIAAYRDTMGCTLLPPHWSSGDIPRLPYVHRALPRHHSDIAYPLGDAADPTPDRRQRTLLDKAFDGESYGAGTLTAGILIIRNGRIVAERYAPGFGIHQGYRTWSTAKSITASLVGIATDRGLMDLDAPAGIPEWQGPADPRAAITPRQLLHMSSGLWSEGSNTNAVYFAGQDVISAATSTRLEAYPGHPMEVRQQRHPAARCGRCVRQSMTI